MTSFSGWIALSLMILAFYFAIRSPFLNRLFGELKLQLQWHHYVGFACTAATLWHVGQLLWDFREAWHLLWLDLSVITGWISFIGLTLVIIFSFFRTAISYRLWRKIHLISSASLVAALIHTYLIYEPAAQREWLIFLGFVALGFIAFVFTAILPRFRFWGKAYLISQHQELRPGYFLTSLQVQNLKQSISIESGQFIYLRFLDKRFTRIWHPFTIVSTNPQHDIGLLIKARGQDTNQLADLRLPTHVKVWGPFGSRFWKHDDNQLWISYGVGVAIFLGAIRSYPENFQKKVHFICCDGSEDKVFFRDELEKCGQAHPGFSWEVFIGSGYEFIQAFDKRSLSSKNDLLVRICGHPGFQNSVKMKLIAKGIPRSKIHLEGL
ncbi:MAG: ferric reductase-like transmembrane domain-containing protein [Oligoflexus sp.]